MQFKVPKTYKDLTLGQLMTLNTEEDATKRVHSCCDITMEELRKMPAKDITMADAHLLKIRDQEVGKHFKVIEVNGKDYGFINDWSSFSLGEWIDTEQYCGDFWNNAHKIMSVLYRPIDRKQGEAYTVMDYTAKENADLFLEVKAELFAGCMLFFSSTRTRLLNTMRLSLLEVAQEASSQKNGAGTPSYTRLPKRTYSRLTKLQSYLSGWLSRISHFSKT